MITLLSERHFGNDHLNTLKSLRFHPSVSLYRRNYAIGKTLEESHRDLVEFLKVHVGGNRCRPFINHVGYVGRISVI